MCIRDRVRTVHSLEVTEKSPETDCAESFGGRQDFQGKDIDIEISGDGFLYNMVRIIAGTLVEVGMGKISPEAVKHIVESKDRTLAGHTAPPQGLFLVEVYY